VRGSSLGENLRMRAAPDDGQDVERVVETSQLGRIEIDDRDIVAFAAETVGDVRADLAGAHYDYVHVTVLPREGLDVAHEPG